MFAKRQSALAAAAGAPPAPRAKPSLKPVVAVLKKPPVVAALAGVFLLVLVVGFGDVVALIPMAALVAVMVMVSVGTFDWHSIRPATLRAQYNGSNP